MLRHCIPWLALSCAALLLPGAAHARQDAVFELPSFNPLSAIIAVEDLVLRAPDRDIDRLFLAVHASMQSEQESTTLCALFDNDAQGDIDSLQRAANTLGPESQQRFVDALAGITLAGLQNDRQAYDPAAAKQALKSAGARAMFLHEGFTEGMAAIGTDADSRALRCRSFRWLVGALEGFPVAERVSATRFLMAEGLVAYRQSL